MKYFKLAMMRGKGNDAVFIKFVEGVAESADKLVEGEHNPKGLIHFRVLSEVDLKTAPKVDIPKLDKYAPEKKKSKPKTDNK